MAASRSAKVWKWGEGQRKPARLAQVFGETLDQIKNHKGTWSAQDIVDAARPRSSKIHGLFEWDNSKAAEMYRQEQARSYVRALVVEIVTPKGSREIPVGISFGPGKGYVSTEKVLGSRQMREQLIAQALAEATSWRERYNFLNELSAIFTAIERATRRGSAGMARRTG